jgi:exodeoxyribonuclease III
VAVYSWWSNRAGARAKDVGWRLDYQLATPGLAAHARAYQVPRMPLLSDHAPVVVDYDLEPRP